jgi:hypothetical protein
MMSVQTKRPNKEFTMFSLIRRTVTIASVLAVGAVAVPAAAFAQAPSQTVIFPHKPAPSMIQKVPDHWGGASTGAAGSWSDAECEEAAGLANILTEQSSGSTDPVESYTLIENARLAIQGALDGGCIIFED